MKILQHFTLFLRHAPIKHQLVKSSSLPVWYVHDIGEARKLRDKFKRMNELPEYNLSTETKLRI